MNRGWQGAGRARRDALVSIALVLLVAGLVGRLLDGSDRPAPVLDPQDRAALGGQDIVRGDPPAVTYPVPADPDAVARGYLVAAYAATPGDAGRTRLDAARYAEPGSPPAVVGVPVLDPPVQGARRVAAVDALVPASAAPQRARLSYLAEVRMTTGSPGAAVRTSLLRTQIVVHRQPDGRWLVVAETPDTADTPALPADDG